MRAHWKVICAVASRRWYGLFSTAVHPARQRMMRQRPEMVRTMNSAAIEDEAVRWFVRHESGSFNSEEEALFQAWLEASTIHRIAYIRVEAAWNHASRLKALSAGVTSGVLPPRGSWGDKRFFKGLTPE